jgi:hypothetical protein
MEEPKGLQAQFQNRKKKPKDQEGAVAPRRVRARLGGTTTSSPTAGADPGWPVATSHCCPSSPRNLAYSPQIPQHWATGRSSPPTVLRWHPIWASWRLSTGSRDNSCPIAGRNSRSATSSSANSGPVAGHYSGTSPSSSSNSGRTASRPSSPGA